MGGVTIQTLAGLAIEAQQKLQDLNFAYKKTITLNIDDYSLIPTLKGFSAWTICPASPSGPPHYPLTVPPRLWLTLTF